MNTDTDGLRARLDGFELDEAGAVLPFSARLARENGWTMAYTGRVIREYKRFLFLAAAAGHPVSPPEAVDQAWHLHMVYTRSYWDRLCGEVLGRPLHHEPTQGGAAEGAKFHDWYARTLESYRRHFGSEPPADLWPAPDAPKTAADGRWADTSRYWLVPKFLRLPRWLRSVAQWGLLPAAVTGLFLTGCVPLESPSTFDLTGGPFLVLYALLYGLALCWAMHLRRKHEAKFTSPAPPDSLTDPYEVAMLAGGGRRVLQVALATMVHSDTLWRTGLGRYKANPQLPPEPLHPVELALWKKATTKTDGVTLATLAGALRSELHILENRLAMLGLKPTARDRSNAGCATSLPFLLLLGFGALKLMIGIARNKPVGFLALFLLLTFFTMLFLRRRFRPLTSSGQDLLRRQRSQLASQPFTGDTIGMNVALLGVAALASQPALAELQRELTAQQQAAAGNGSTSSSSSSSSGCGSGCSASACGTSSSSDGGGGSSGCGSSGCGGCGGGGGD
jgi:uncharacterized protein (TIGR04222 family)